MTMASETQPHAALPELSAPVQGPRPVGPEMSRTGKVLTTQTGLHMPVGLNFDVWEKTGRQLAGIVDSSAWWLGDWLVYGKDHYPDRYERSIRIAGLKYQTLRNYAWVSRRFSLDRRRDTLSFQHHAEVASLPLDEQEKWLDRAEEKKWSTKLLRDSIQDARDNTNRIESRPATRRLALPSNRVQWWYKAAERSGIEFQNWIQLTLDNAAQRVLEE